MIALDTNLLVRLVLQDDAAQARVVERLLIQARREDTSLYIADVVLCELVWVLTRRAKITRAAIADTIARLLRTELVVVTDARSIESALDSYRVGRGDFADYLIRSQAQRAGATEVVTFDRALKGDAGFRIVG
jgi:predicted nucleic-acid-binding protein